MKRLVFAVPLMGGNDDDLQALERSYHEMFGLDFSVAVWETLGPIAYMSRLSDTGKVWSTKRTLSKLMKRAEHDLR